MPPTSCNKLYQAQIPGACGTRRTKPRRWEAGREETLIALEIRLQTPPGQNPSTHSTLSTHRDPSPQQQGSHAEDKERGMGRGSVGEPGGRTGGKSGVTETPGKPGRTPRRVHSARLCRNRPVVVCSREPGCFVIGEECALFTATPRHPARGLPSRTRGRAPRPQQPPLFRATLPNMGTLL